MLAGVRDLEGARSVWQRLGFTVTPRGRHIGWGTGNYCIMFPTDYVELLGVVDAAGDLQGLDTLLARREGLLGLALATDDVATLHGALTTAGLADGPPADLARLLEAPEGTLRPAFKLVHPADPERHFGLKIFACHHLTPDLVWQPAWLTHANGARRIAALTAAVPSVAAVLPAYRALLGDGAVAADSRGATVRLGAAVLRLAEDAEIAGPIGLAVEVADLSAAGALLSAAGIAFKADGDGLHVDPSAATGVALSFVGG